MKNILFLASMISCFGCFESPENSKEHVNGNVHDIAVGDTCMIYYLQNTCCINCICNEKDLDNIELQSTVTMEEEDSDCIGCNVQSAYVIRGIKPGVDTFKIRSAAMSEADRCKEDTLYMEKYIIRVH